MSRISKIFVDEIPFFFAAPAFLWEFFFLYAPFAVLTIHSLFDYNLHTGTYNLTFEFYHQVINSLYINIIFRSFSLAAATAFICFLIAYPVAYFLVMKSPEKYKSFLLFSLILPSWTSLIVQVYAWFFLLEKNSWFSRFLQAVGILSPTSHLLNNYFSIMLGMVSCYLPFMILPIYAVLEKLDKRLMDASADLGADRYETFKRIVFPLSLPGVYAGLLLVFIPSFGEFAIPGLLGGSKYIFWGSVIVDKFLFSRDWRVGAALVVTGILIPVALLMLIYFIAKINKRIQIKKISGYSENIDQNIARDIWD